MRDKPLASKKKREWGIMPFDTKLFFYPYNLVSKWHFNSLSPEQKKTRYQRVFFCLQGMRGLANVLEALRTVAIGDFFDHQIIRFSFLQISISGTEAHGKTRIIPVPPIPEIRAICAIIPLKIFLLLRGNFNFHEFDFLIFLPYDDGQFPVSEKDNSDSANRRQRNQNPSHAHGPICCARKSIFLSFF